MFEEQFRVLNLFTIAFVIFWTSTLGGLLFWAEHKEEMHVTEYAKKEARANFNKDIAFRNWVARRGGVYVKVSELTQPNPFLSHIPYRDIESPSGGKLTLMNPAYVLRQTMDEFSELYGIKGRITSLKPLNPNNAPDDWETKILIAFESGELTETYEVNHIDNEPYLRYMQAFITKESCLKCHAHQGYIEGNIRGGIGVSVPLEPYITIKNETVRILRFSYGSLLLLGLVIIVFIYRVIKNKITSQNKTQQKLDDERQKAHNLAMHDPLTELPNRRFFQQYTENLLIQSERHKRKTALLYIDLDGFKAVNDDISHQAGDDVLKSCANRFKQCLRKNELIARIGGDEFCLVIYDYKDKDELINTATRLIKNSTQEFNIGGMAIKIGVTIGIASYPDNAKSYSDLLASADDAMYQAKNNQKGTYSFAT